MTMRLIKRVTIAAAVLIPAMACMTGPSAKSVRLVREARGAAIMVEGSRAKVRGELLEVRDEHLVIWDGCAVKLVPFVLIRDSGFTGIDPKWIQGTPTPAEREQLRLLSRFPTGAPAGVIAELAKCAGATEAQVVEL